MLSAKEGTVQSDAKKVPLGLCAEVYWLPTFHMYGTHNEVVARQRRGVSSWPLYSYCDGRTPWTGWGLELWAVCCKHPSVRW
jgi:hypothetical protein